MYSLNRFIKRIALPALFVALLAALSQCYLSHRFAEENVRNADTARPQQHPQP